MDAVTTGICPNCETRHGEIGDPCPGELCAKKGYHYIPEPWFKAAKELASRKRLPLDSLLGRYINRYLLAGKLGEGGMGAVYVALQKPLMREVALKLISGMELNESAIARFEREARAIALLDHPNIVKLHDYGVGEGDELKVPYMAIEYVKHGRTLRRALSRIREESGGSVPGEIVRNIFHQILNALAAAHRVGLVHRDMKPDNVLIVPVEGNPHFVKVLDFGLAKAVSEITGFDGDVSRTGQFLGTPYYMAPEQVPKSGEHAKADHRADLYAVAVMLFEVFTGIRPYDANSPLAILTKKTDPTFRPLELPEARNLPGPLVGFLERGLAISPEDRFPDAPAMLEALDAALSGVDLTARGPVAPDSGSSQERPLTPPSVDLANVDHASATAAVQLEHVSDIAADGPPGGTARRKGAWLVAGLLAAFLVGIGAYLASGGREASETGAVVGAPKPSAAKAPALDAAAPGDTGEAPPGHAGLPTDAAKTAAAQVDAARAEAVLSFVVDTSPVKAVVWIEGKEFGKAPVEYSLRQGEAPQEIEIRAAAKGWKAATVAVDPAEASKDGSVVLELKRVKKKAAPKRRKPGTRKPAKKKPRKTGVPLM